VGEEPLPGEALVLTLDAVPENISVARRAVVDYARACKADVDRVALAISEAVTNVVRHAYRGRRAGPVRVKAELDHSDLVVTVADEGRGMEPRTDSPGMGMGLAIIGSVAGGMQLQSSDAGGLAMSIRFPCAGDD
jgi:serine/threonine-protein kinase RsbW